VSDIEPDLNHLVQNDQQTRREFAVASRYPGLACNGCQAGPGAWKNAGDSIVRESPAIEEVRSS
jgi:hypothetical protein